MQPCDELGDQACLPWAYPPSLVLQPIS